MSNIHIVRQHSENASETSIWRELTASYHEILMFHNCVHARDLVTTQSFSYGFSWWSRCNPQQQDNLFCSHTKREPKRTDQSRDIDEQPPHVYILFSWVSTCNLPCLNNIFSCLYSIPLWSKFFEPCLISTLCASTAKMLLKRQFGVSWRPLIMKFSCFTIACTHETLLPLNLSHMDFPDGPVAIHSSRTTYSVLTQSASPNELINPEILMNNHHMFTYCFLGFRRAIFLASIISSHACIVFLSEASSSSHV